MEILNDQRSRRTVLMVTDGIAELSALRDILENEYNTILMDNSSRDFALIKEQSGELSAAVIAAKEAAAENYGLFDWISRDSMIAAIPMLIYCETEEDRRIAGECLARGAVDIISPPLNKEIILHRMRNSIRIKDSATFLEIEKMLHELPSNIYLKDEKGRYIFATHYWHHLDHSSDPNWTIRGKTDVEIRKDRENAIKAMETDKEIIRTGEGTDYVIEINTDGIQEFLELIKRPLKDENGKVTGIIALINDVTEKELLKQSLEEKALMDELTGVGNRRSFERFTDAMALSDMLPVCFVSADCNGLKAVNDTYGHLVGDEYIRMSALLMRTVLPEDSNIFRVGGDEFMIILPSTDEVRAREIIASLKKEEGTFAVKENPISISYGVSCMETAEDTVKKFIELADRRMYDEKQEYKKHRSK